MASVKPIRPTATILAVVLVVGCAGPTATTMPSPPARSLPAASASASPVPSRVVHDGIIPVSTGEPITVDELSGRIVFDDFEDVFAMDVDGSNVVKVAGDPTGSEFDGAWSPDGEWVVYRDSTRGINEDDEIFVARADGSEPRNITNNPANDWGPDWSPDGSDDRLQLGPRWWPAARLPRRSGRLEPAVDRRRCLVRVPVVLAGWHEDRVRGPPGVGLRGLRRGPRFGRRRAADRQPGTDGWPAWSPDGSSIAFTSERDDCALVPPDQQCWRGDVGDEHRDTWLMDADGSNQRRVSPENGQFVAWSPDSQYLLISGRALYVVRPDGTGRLELRADGISLPLGGIPDWR